MKVEQFQGFLEAGGEFVLWRILRRRAGPASRVCDEFAFWVVDGDHNAAIHGAISAESDAELLNRLRHESPFGQIRMRAVEVPKFETKRLVRPHLCCIITNC